MFRNTPAFSSFSVDDLGKAKAFYAEVLGLDVSTVEMDEMPERYRPLEVQLAGGHRVMLYAKPDHQPATFTVLNFTVTDIDAAIDELSGRGIGFEQYDGDIATDGKGIHRSSGVAVAWFRDPAGNMLSVIEET